MTRLTLATALIAGLSASTSAAAERPIEVDYKPTLSLGISFALGATKPASTGIALRVLSTNEMNSPAATAGVIYYLGSGTFGFDLGVAYNLNGSMSSALTYDFLNQGAVFSLSGADLQKKPEFPRGYE